MNDEHFRQVRAIVEQSNRLAKEFEEKYGRDKAIDILFVECSRLWVAQFPQSQGWGKRLHIDLSGADLSGALFAGVGESLKGANFKDATLDRTRWFFVSLENADFMNASLRNSSFIKCFAFSAIFSGADLKDASVNISSGAKSRADFTGADLRNAELILGMVHPVMPTHFFTSELLLTGANMEGCRVTVGKGDGRVRGKQLHKFLQSLSEEQKRQVTFTEPALQPIQSKDCFIATAVYGSPFTPQVQVLQQFRREHLEPHWLGRRFVRAYYRVSPPLAEWVRERPRVRRMVRSILDFALVVLARWL